MSSEQKNALEESVQERTQRQREALNNAYGFVLADQATQAFQGFSFEEALDLQIEEIEGESTDVRPNKLARIDRIEEQMTVAVEQLKDVPDELFQEASEIEDVNTG